VQKVCVWAGIPMLALLLAGLLASGFLVAPSPHWSAPHIAHFYRNHTTRIRLGLVFGFCGFIAFFPFAGGIAAQTRRIAGAGRALAYVQNAAIGSASIAFIGTWCLWVTAAFRAGRPASEIQLLNDLGWVLFVFPFPAFTAWNWAIGIAILTDRRTPPIYERWVGYANLFLGALFLPDVLVPLFKTGPFCWRGVMTYYGPLTWFGIWMVAMMITTSRAIDDEARVALAK
jgi:hypothetical protein